jgi:hypothetical protein
MLPVVSEASLLWTSAPLDGGKKSMLEFLQPVGRDICRQGLRREESSLAGENGDKDVISFSNFSQCFAKGVVMV